MESRTCTRKDVIVPLIVIAYVGQRDEELQKIFENVFEGHVFQNVKEYAEWISKRERWLSHEGTNGFKVFESIIAETERRSEEQELARMLWR